MYTNYNTQHLSCKVILLTVSSSSSGIVILGYVPCHLFDVELFLLMPAGAKMLHASYSCKVIAFIGR